MEERRNQDLVDALTRFDNGRGLPSFIQKNQFELCEHTISPNLILSDFGAHESIIADTLAPNSLFDKNMKLYHYIQKVGNPRRVIDTLDKTKNEKALEIIRKGLKEAGELGEQTFRVGEATGEILGGGSGIKTGNESRSASSGIRNEQNEQSRPVPTSSYLASSRRAHDDEKEFQKKTESYDCQNVRVLFINQKFDSPGKSEEYRKKKRDGADADRQHVENLFKKTLKMDVQVEPNVDSKNFPVILKRFKQNCIDEGNDGCIIIVSTHGADPHFLLMDDLKLINLEKDVIQQFGRDKFPGFDGKPKIFLFNACRTEMTEIPKLDLFTDEDSSTVSLKYADILIGHSTVPYHASHRDKKLGSCYIKALHDVYMENQGHKWEIQDLLETVGRKVGEILDSQNRVQISEVTRRLFCKNFYLTKK